MINIETDRIYPKSEVIQEIQNAQQKAIAVLPKNAIALLTFYEKKVYAQ